jgi:membrane fusion protein (multidrug efflux system)
VSKAFVARIVVVLALLVVGGGLAFWKHRSMAGPAAAGWEPAESVQIVEAGTTRWRPTAELSGTVIAQQSVTLSNEVAGTVKDVLFQSGAIVEAGQVLVTLDTTTEEADLRATEANVEVNQASVKVAEADERLADANFRRLTQAVEARAVSEADLDTARSTLDAAKARVLRSRAELDQARARVDQMKATIAKKTLRAPFKATAGLRNVHPGQYLAEGTTVVGLQSVSDQIYLDFALPQEYAARAHPGLVVMATAPMLGNDPIRIEVVALDAVADPTTRNVRTRAVIANPDGKLRPGMFVDIVTPVGEPDDFVIVPSTAVRHASFGDHVFIIGPDEKDPTKFRAHQQFITLGPMVGSNLIVLKGLKPGDQVAANGSFKLREGALVMKTEPAPTPTPGTPADTKASAQTTPGSPPSTEN